jgi:hypothetical protein
MGTEGYLATKGLVTLPKDEFEKVKNVASAMEPLKADAVK